MKGEVGVAVNSERIEEFSGWSASVGKSGISLPVERFSLLAGNPARCGIGTGVFPLDRLTGNGSCTEGAARTFLYGCKGKTDAQVHVLYR